MVDLDGPGVAPLVCSFAPDGTGKSFDLTGAAQRVRETSDRTVVALDPVRDDLGVVGRSANTVWLVDDVHLASDRSIDILADAIGEVRLPSQVVLAGRFEPGLRLARHRSSGRVTDVTELQLRLDLSEIRALVEDLAGPLSERDLDAIAHIAQGWPGAVFEIAQHASTGDGSITDSIEEAAAAISAAALARLDESAGRMLVQTSILSELDDDACREIVGTGGTAQLYATTRRAGVFMVPTNREASAFRVHSILRLGLQRRLAELASPDELRDLHRRSAAHFLNIDALRSAEHSLAACDPTGAADAVALHLAQNPSTCDPVIDDLIDRIDASDHPPHLVSMGVVAARHNDFDTLTGVIERLQTATWSSAVPQGYPSLEAAIHHLEGHLPRVSATVRRELRALGDIELDTADEVARLLRYQAAHVTYFDGELDRAADMARSITQGHLSIGREQVFDQVATALAVDLTALIEHDRGRRGPAVDAHGHATYLRDVVYAHDQIDVRTQQVHDLVDALLGDRSPGSRTAALRDLATNALTHSTRLHALTELAAHLDRCGSSDAAITVVEDAERALDEESPPMLIERVRLLRVAVDDAVIAPGVFVTITPGERAVYRLLAEDLTQAEMSERLDLSVNTVKSHLRSVYLKCGVSTRHDAIDFGLRCGLLATVVPWAETSAKETLAR